MSKLYSLLLACFLFLSSCTEQIDTSVRYVFTTNTVASYLQKHEQYSEYYRLLDKTPVSSISNTTLLQLLTARGNYTVFAPTNEAIQLYLDTLVKNDIIDEASWNGFRDSASLDSVEKVIVYNSIIDGGDNFVFPTYDLPTTSGADIPLSNMYDRKLTVTYNAYKPGVIFVNDCPIDERNRDIPVLNGFIHAMNRVIAPSNNTLSHLLSNIISRKEEGYYVAAMLADACGMKDTLRMIRDDQYEFLYQTGVIEKTTARLSGLEFYTPEHRYYGFTYFAETDSLWSDILGMPALDITVQDVVDYLAKNNIYPDARNDKNYTSEDNLLNRFVTYHFLPMMLQPGKLVYHYNELGYLPYNSGTPTVAMAEFYTTMGKPRLLKVFESGESKGIYLNRFPKIDNGRHGSYHELSCDPDKAGIFIGEPNREGQYNVRNGIIYPIDRLLVFDTQTRDNMGRERIRWDAAAMFPEMINNDIRISELTDSRHFSISFPSDEQYRYLENAWCGRSQNLHYRTGRDAGWTNYLGDEFQLDRIPDMIIRMPPVPRRGTYELRFGINTNEMRSMVQCYWGTNRDALYATGLPLDTRIGGRYRYTSNGTFPSEIGWEQDTEDDDYNAEVDKRMRNKDYMKNCNLMAAGTPGTSTTLRRAENCIRRIILRQTMDPDEIYYLRFKGVLDDENKFLFMDYLEYCPKEVYDNPETPEDIW
ncbi:MAG: fasciclin domain-containing protein [Bacteroidaceae bacterium]|nr:fasciclin domain-containing protein [Bacteroidaceae bacterium]